MAAYWAVPRAGFVPPAAVGQAYLDTPIWIPHGQVTTRPTRPGPGSLFGHVKADYPHLLTIRDPATLRAELAVVREHYNTVRLHARIGYVTPDDEHEGRGEQIRKARQAGLEQARLRRIAYHRATPP